MTTPTERERTAISLAGRVALITGALGDLGTAIAEAFLAAGAAVALLDLQAEPLALRAASLGAPERVLGIACDVADAQATCAAIEQTVAHFGALHIVINNAAVVSGRFPVADIPIDEWRAAFDVNVTGAYLISKWAIPHLRAAGGGVVLNIASQLGHVTVAGRGAYSASKAALIALARSIAVDHAGDGIRALSLSPGSIMTSRLTTRYGDEAAVNRVLAPRHPIGRIGTPQEVAQAALFLVGDGASFITGTDLLVDGAYTAV